ncbi:MAG: class A beta-lactamase [Thermodesulfobacteriota bacterium]
MKRLHIEGPNRKFRIFLIITSLALFCFAACVHYPEKIKAPDIERPAFKNLVLEIQGAAKLAGGVVGVSALHLETGRRIGFNAQECFPMASVYKIPIAVQLLHLVDRGQISLEKMVTLQPQDLRPGSGIIATYLNKPGVVLSVQNLLELMLVISDNTATDILLRLAGGPQAVTERLRAMGVSDMDVSRPTINLIADSTGFLLPPEKEWNLELLKKLHAEVPPETKKAAAQNFLKDSRDTSTPEAMISLLKLIYRGNVLKKDTRDILLDIMSRCQTGQQRLKGMLLSEIYVAHKTGTIAGMVNDVGVITLPYNAGRIVIAIFMKPSEKDMPTRERAMAHISRAIYDFFLFNTGPH